jgi:hypothetical protein
MIDEATGQAITQQMHQHWIGPELEARIRAGTLAADFQIRRCLIKLPQGSKPIVEFNAEVKLRAKVKLPGHCKPEAGDVASLDDIEYIERVYPPEVGGVRVAFCYAHWVNGQFAVFFDFTPNHDDIPQSAADEWTMGEAIGQAVHSSLVELALAVHDTIQADLTKIGLWAAPAILPYPLSRIASLVQSGDDVSARRLFVEYCSVKRLGDLLTEWWSVPAFAARRKLFEQAFEAHTASQFYLSVSTLVPHLEGVMTDWLHASIPDMPWKQESKTKKFRDLVAANPDATPTYRRVVESAISFILEGPALATFKNWLDSFDVSFANRNVVGHGRFDDRVYSEENSIKLFLMLDTIRQVLAAQAQNLPVGGEAPQQSGDA